MKDVIRAERTRWLVACLGFAVMWSIGKTHVAAAGEPGQGRPILTCEQWEQRYPQKGWEEAAKLDTPTACEVTDGELTAMADRYARRQYSGDSCVVSPTPVRMIRCSTMT
jgi:hypothetical protein